MHNLISIQGKYASHYRFKQHSAQSFKNLIQGITGKCCAVISSRFRSDLIYCSETFTHKEALKLWSVHLKEEFDQKQRHLFVFKKGKEAVLNHYFNSLNEFCRIHGWYEEYVDEFNALLALDTNNPVLQLIAECDYHLAKETASNRSPLFEGNSDHFQLNKMELSTILNELLMKPERNN